MTLNIAQHLILNAEHIFDTHLPTMTGVGIMAKMGFIFEMNKKSGHEETNDLLLEALKIISVNF